MSLAKPTLDTVQTATMRLQEVSQFLSEKMACVEPTPATAHQWRPWIGERVRCTEQFLDQYPKWRGLHLWVIGIQIHPTSNHFENGLNITVSDEWPVRGRSNAGTDGFYINRPFKSDDLEPYPDIPEVKAA